MVVPELRRVWYQSTDGRQAYDSVAGNPEESPCRFSTTCLLSRIQIHSCRQKAWPEVVRFVAGAHPSQALPTISASRGSVQIAVRLTPSGRWQNVSGEHEAEIVTTEKNVYLGRFDTPEGAGAA